VRWKKAILCKPGAHPAATGKQPSQVPFPAQQLWNRLIDPFDQQNLLVVVDLLELDLDDLAAAGGHMLADVGGLDGQFAVASVDEYGRCTRCGRP